MENNRSKGLPSLEKVIEQAKRLKENGGGNGVRLVVHPEGFNLTLDEQPVLPNQHNNPENRFRT